MANVLLEFDFLEILRDRKRWDLYFVLATEHPTDEDRMVLTVVPDPSIRLRPPMNNRIDFVPTGNDASGLMVLQRPRPADNTLRTRVYLFQSNDNTRNFAAIMKGVTDSLGDEVLETVVGLFGGAQPWVVVSKAVFTVLTEILENVRDRGLGFLSLDEHFTTSFDKDGEVDRSNKFSTGFAKLAWTWKAI